MTAGVTLYVPCYNGRRYIPDVIRGIARQTWPVEECILVDDGSTDGSAELAAEVASSLRLFLRVIRHPSNRGLAAARNTAISACRTDFLAALDADVQAESDWLATLMAEMTRDAALAGVCGNLREKHTAALPDRWRAAHLRQNYGDRPRDDPPVLFGANHAHRLAWLRRVGGYDERNRAAGDDASLTRKIREAGGRTRYLPQAVCWHLRRDTIASVLTTYWRWKYFGNWTDDRRTIRRLRAAVGDLTVATGRLVRTDARRRAWDCVLLDLLYPAISVRAHWNAWRRAL